jgi:hypothetical protein
MIGGLSALESRFREGSAWPCIIEEKGMRFDLHTTLTLLNNF